MVKKKMRKIEDPNQLEKVTKLKKYFNSFFYKFIYFFIIFLERRFDKLKWIIRNDIKRKKTSVSEKLNIRD